MINIILIFIIFSLIIWCIYIEPNFLDITKYTIEDNDLKGLRIVFASDFHLKKYQEKRLLKIINVINKQNPDIILFGGDFVNERNIKKTLDIKIILKHLCKLKSKYGIYTTFGNHEYIYINSIKEDFEKIGIKVLLNKSYKLETGEKSIYISGIEDLLTGSPNIEKATKDTENATILLTHSPDIFPTLPNNSKINLTLAGHVHGGQVRLPFVGATIIPSQYGNKYSMGLISEQGNKMIVTKGIGTSILPIRFNCHPEIVVIEFE